MTVIVTGAAGFIGMHVARALLARGRAVVGIDNLSPYYDPALKRARLAELAPHDDFTFHEADISDRAAMAGIFTRHAGTTEIVHLAAQAGVRHSLDDPYAYVTANVMGQIVLLEAARGLPALRHFVYASSSSVYGGNSKIPFSVADPVDTPISVYAATKRADELLAHTYAHLHGLPSTGLRFFTVYGPWGRPDMAAYKFAEAITQGRPIEVYNHGEMRRDFTYIDDVVEGVLGALDRPPRASAGDVPTALYNLGNSRAEPLTRYIELLESALGRKAEKIMAPIQPGDVAATWADIEASRRDLGYAPETPIDVGIPRFVEWYRGYHGLDTPPGRTGQGTGAFR